MYNQTKNKFLWRKFKKIFYIDASNLKPLKTMNDIHVPPFFFSFYFTIPLEHLSSSFIRKCTVLERYEHILFLPW